MVASHPTWHESIARIHRSPKSNYFFVYKALLRYVSRVVCPSVSWNYTQRTNPTFENTNILHQKPQHWLNWQQINKIIGSSRSRKSNNDFFFNIARIVTIAEPILVIWMDPRKKKEEMQAHRRLPPCFSQEIERAAFAMLWRAYMEKEKCCPATSFAEAAGVAERRQEEKRREQRKKTQKILKKDPGRDFFSSTVDK